MIWQWSRRDLAASALVLVNADMAIVTPVGGPAAIAQGVLDDGGTRVFDHELVATGEALAKHLGGIPSDRRSDRNAGQHQ